MPADQEMAERLAKLKGVPTSTVGPTQTQKSAGFYHAPETRPPAKQSDDLLRQMGEEVKIDEGKRQADEEINVDIAERLAKLKGISSSSSRDRPQDKVDHEEEMNSDEEAEKLVQQVRILLRVI